MPRSPPLKSKVTFDQLLMFIVKCIFTVLLLWLVVYTIDFEKLTGQINHLPLIELLKLFIGAVFLLMLQAPILAWRWMRIVSHLGGLLSFKQAIRLIFINLFFNQTLPTSAGGDAIRVWLACQSGLTLRLSLNSVLLERLSGLLALILLVEIFLPTVWLNISPMAIKLLLICLLPFAILVILVLLLLNRVTPRLINIQIPSAITKFATDMYSILRSPGLTVELFVLGIAGGLLVVGVIYIFGVNLGIKLTFSQYICLVPAVILLSLLPISIAGWGVREGAMVMLLGNISGNKEMILTISILYGLTMIIAALPGGIFWLIKRPQRDSTA